MVDQRINSALYVVSLIPGQMDATSPNIVADPTLTSVALVWLPCCTMFHDAEWCWAKFGFYQTSSSTSSNISFLLSCEQQCCIPKKDETKYHLRKKIIIITFASVFNIVERASAHWAGFAGTCIHCDDLLIVFALRVAVWWGTCSSTMFDFTVWTFLLMVQSWRKKILGWEPCTEKMYARDGVLKGDVNMALQVQGGGHYRANFSTTYK